MNYMAHILVDALYLLALINPVSKVSILCMSPSEETNVVLRRTAARSSAVAVGILFSAMVFGDFILHGVFRVEYYSLQVAGGVVLFWFGFNALRSGVFFEQETQARFADLAIVPLACPLIAGPATITASLALAAQRGLPSAACSMLIAVLINLLIMLLSGPIGALLGRFNIMGAIIRLTGLIVMTIGVQMVLEGISTWAAALQH